LKKSTRIIDYDSKALLEEDFRKSHLQEVLTGLEITKFNGWTKITESGYVVKNP